MELLDVLTVHHGDEARTIELYHGDLSDLKPEEAVDILVVSAFPNNYEATATSLIGSLAAKGVSVAELAQSKEVDLRQAFSCWLSKEIAPTSPGIQFKRILCFEPAIRGRPPEVVGDIFQCLAPFLGGRPPMSTVAMPLVATGDQGVQPSEMFSPLLDAATHWMALGLPLKRLKIVQRSRWKAGELKSIFSVLKGKYGATTLQASSSFKYDVFLSYAHTDSEKALLLAEELQRRRPSSKIFVDRKELNCGAAWQQEIFEALDACRAVIAVYSPSYIQSKVCKEEFNIALYRDRESKEKVLFPVYLYTAQLPTYMKVIQFADCREGDEAQLRSFCEKFAPSLRS